MFSHAWVNTVNGHPLATMCAACGTSLVPMPAPHDWRSRLKEFGNRLDCPGGQSYTPTGDAASASAKAHGTVPADRKDDDMNAGHTERATMREATLKPYVEPFADAAEPKDSGDWDGESGQVNQWAELDLEDFRENADQLSLARIRSGVSQAERVADEHARRATRARALAERLRQAAADTAGHLLPEAAQTAEGLRRG